MPSALLQRSDASYYQGKCLKRTRRADSQIQTGAIILLLLWRSLYLSRASNNSRFSLITKGGADRNV